MRRILNVMFLCGAILMLIACGGGKKKTTRTAGYVMEMSDSVISNVVDTLSLGRIKEGEMVEKQLLLRNGTAVPFVLERIEAGCGCLSFAYSKEPVLPGGSAAVTMRFDSRGFTGEIVRTATFHTTLAGGERKLRVEATIN